MEEDTSEAITPPKDFFASYDRAERVWSEWIAEQPEDAGYSTVLQDWDFEPGSNSVLEFPGRRQCRGWAPPS